MFCDLCVRDLKEQGITPSWHDGASTNIPEKMKQKTNKGTQADEKEEEEGNAAQVKAAKLREHLIWLIAPQLI